jgi:hypothetical protein
MAIETREGDPRPPERDWSPRTRPWTYALAAIAVGLLGAYVFGDQRSESERNGVLTATDADNDVIPSVSPDGRDPSAPDAAR